VELCMQPDGAIKTVLVTERKREHLYKMCNFPAYTVPRPL